MKTILSKIRLRVAHPMLWCALLAVTLIPEITSCTKETANVKPAEVDYYTCTMHPSVKSQDPHGKCPICSMDLVPVLKKSAATVQPASAAANQDAPTEFIVPVKRLQQIGVTYAAIGRRPLKLALRVAGTVNQDAALNHGRKLSSGEHPADLAELSVVWVWAQCYQDELPMLKKGLPVTITSSSFPGEKFTGKISLVDPFIDETSRTGRARIEVENSDLKLRPGMYVDADLEIDMGEGVAVPVDAVLPTGRHNIVFVDKGGGKLEPRYIEIGRQYGDFYEVKGGLKETERVVTSANFLIDAEAKVQGALKSW